jgi:hypothetical protein
MKASTCIENKRLSFTSFNFTRSKVNQNSDKLQTVEVYPKFYLTNESNY